jgi:hypothetical protein
MQIMNRELVEANSVPGHLKRFGTRNPETTFYVIRQPGTDRGLFSLFSSVLCHLDLCDKLECLPVIDFQNFPCVYNDADVHSTSNAWEYYFEPINQITVEEVYESQRVFLSQPCYPAGYSYSITNEPALREVYRKYIRIKNEITQTVNQYYANHFSEHTVLGVHFRGQEMRIAPGHWFPPSKSQITTIITTMLKRFPFDRIFAVSEDSGHISFLENQFGPMVISNNHFRTSGDNAYNYRPRPQHHFLLGREVLIDTLLLARCHGLVACTSNVAECARFFNNSQYLAEIKINNGPNSNYKLIARYLWFIKSILPTRLGGFHKKFRIKTPQSFDF